MKTVLVTGGAGFIGSHFIRLLLNENGYFVINYDLLTYAGNLNNLRDVDANPNYIYIKGDIRNRSDVEHLFSTYDIDVVVNFAAESHVDRSIVAADDFITTNILGAQTLMDVAKASWMNPDDGSFKKGKKFIQISTDEVYGSVFIGSSNEESALLPNSPYSAAKASADLIARAYHKTYGFPVIITRSSNNYGEKQYPEKLIPLFIELAKKNKNLPVYGDGNQIRDWIHVTDHCQAILTVLREGEVGEIYNISSSNEMANIDIVKKILYILNKPDSLITYVDDRPGHDFRYSLDSSKILELGWKPIVCFEESFSELVKHKDRG